MTKCPYCNQEAQLEKTYNMMVCKNRSCNFYLKDDVRRVASHSQATQSSQNTPSNFHPLNSLVEEVMDNFDFDKTHEVMRYLNWKWATCNGVPSITDLRSFVRYNLEKIILEGRKTLNNTGYITGGFELRYFPDVDLAEVKFVLTEWETCIS